PWWRRRRSTASPSRRASFIPCSTIRRESGCMVDAPLRITPRGPLDVAQVAAFGDVAEMTERLSKYFWLTITPSPTRAVAAGDLTVLWHGPGQSLIVRTPRAAPLADELAALLGEDAAVVDLGHARSVLRFEGDGASEVLARGTSIDLRPAHF